MTRRVTVVLQDDIDGGEPAQTMFFALDGTHYEIDLTEENAAALRDCLAPWIAVARPTSEARIPEPDQRRWVDHRTPPRSAGGRPRTASPYALGGASRSTCTSSSPPPTRPFADPGSLTSGLMPGSLGGVPFMLHRQVDA